MTRFSKSARALSLGLAAALFFYWAKCQLRINLIETIQWENKFPILRAFQQEVRVIEPLPGGVIINETMDEFFPGRHWMPLWTGEPDFGESLVVRGEGLRGSSCMRIDHRSPDRDWILPRFDMIRVVPGETFSVSAMVRTDSAERSVSFRMLAYDKDRKDAPQWIAAEIAPTIDWTRAVWTIKIPDAVHYIRFSIAGRGQETVWVDDLRLVRES